jgi:Xaa-Pro dipeptidase
MDYTKQRLKSIFSRNEIDSALLVNGEEASSNFLYMTGLTSGVFEGTPLLLLKDKMILFANSLEYEIAVENANSSTDVVKISSSDDLLHKISKYTKGKRVGFDGSVLSFKSYSRIKKRFSPKSLVNIEQSFAELRSIKNEDELRSIRKAADIARKAFDAVQDSFAVGITEKKVAAKMDYHMMDFGADETSFKSIVCFGKNAALPHHSPDNTKLQENSFVLIDAGAKYNNYCSDMTRTFIFRPDKSSKKYARMVDIYNTVKEAQRLALASIKEGVECRVPHNVADSYINKAHGGIYKGKFIHALGHSIGIDVHDSDYLGLYPSCKIKMKSGMVFSDEPGIYITGFGGVRIEDDLVVQKNGASIL